MSEYKEPLCLRVKYKLSQPIVDRVKASGGKIQKVIEIVSGEILEYWIDCEEEKYDQMTDYAFMTFIKNPVFQKYYHDTQAFKEIAAEYIDDRILRDSAA